MVCTRGDAINKNNGNGNSGEGQIEEMVQVIGDDLDNNFTNDWDESEPLTWMA